MAIIKTADSQGLVVALTESLVALKWVADEVASNVQALSRKLEETAPSPVASGSDPGLSLEWESGVGRTSAYYQTVQTDFLTGPGYYGWLVNSTKKFSFSGSNLDGLSSGASVVTGVELVSSQQVSRNAAGFSGSQSSQSRDTAVIDYDLSASTFTVSRFDAAASSRWSSSGFDGGFLSGDTNKGAFSAVRSFVGSATYEIDSGFTDLLSATVFSYSDSFRQAWSEDGNPEKAGATGSDAYLFKLKSGSGVTYQGTTVSGSVDALLYSNIHEVRPVGGTASKAQEYFQYTNTASLADDIDLQLLQDYWNDRDSYSLDRWAAELLKGDDLIQVTAPEGGVIYAWAGNDRITGGKGADEIHAGEGSDLLIGGDGRDDLYGGLDNDILKGGNQDDFLYGEEGDDYLDGGSGNDNLYGAAGNDRLFGGAGNDRLDGDDGDDQLEGGAGNDRLDGGWGDDLIKGGAGQDLIFGGPGNDTLDGGAGNDLIYGGSGRDLLSGGTGIDGFLFSLSESGDFELTVESLDQIKGFNVAQDRILLNIAGEITEASTLVLASADAYANLLSAAEAADKLVVIGFDAGNTYLFADMNADNMVDLAIQLVGLEGAAVAGAISVARFDALLP